ncbi:DUF4124 domain-containing protein [Pseudoteredinibacter isoporae]|uniref:DUF4124 domain-containing protein n=1 Tax=Pseudoteredinibacter isoporae TaxID=570281 RepID=UPI003106AB42
MNPATLQNQSSAFFQKPVSHVICALSLLAASLESHAQIYRWQDESGKFQYSDKPRPGATLIKEADEKQPEVIEALPSQEKENNNTEEVLAEGKETPPQKVVSEPEETLEVAPAQAQTPARETTELSKTMSERDQARLKELSRKHRRCASSRTRMSKLQTQFQQRKLEGAPEQTLDYLRRSITRQNKLVSRDCS